MSKIIQLLITYLGIPLAEKFGKWLLSEFKQWQSKRKIIKDQKKKTQAIANGKTKDDIKAAHRSNKL
tara:strand:+ start:1551 stop:1751 length:201 start_codon:yes stop_codon:yes gene_type:complete